MKCSDSPKFVAQSGLFRAWRSSAVIAAVICEVATVAAQSVVAIPPPPAEISTAGPGATGEVLKQPSTAPLQWGPIGVRPHLAYRLTRGNGIQAQPGIRSDTTIQTVSPGIAFDLGERWLADYTPTWTFYSSRVFKDTLSHSASLSGRTSFTDGNIHFGQTYAVSDDPLIETGRQTHQESAATSLGGSYALGQKSRLEAGISQNLRFAENAPTSREWSTNEWFHYQFSSRLDAAVGVGFGYDSINPGADMRFSQQQARIGWRPVDKLSLDVHGGREHRTFSKAGSASWSPPTYGASVSYQPIEVTSFSFSAERSVSASYFVNQASENSSWNLGFNQRLLEHFHLSGGYGRSKTRYVAAAAVIVAGRDDESSTFHLRLSTGFLRRGSIGLVYQHSRNTSNVAAYTFTTSQVGLEISYSY